ncbi:MAG: hypothetical protein ACJ76Z_10730 [Thermoleophilaceae bacterium]
MRVVPSIVAVTAALLVAAPAAQAAVATTADGNLRYTAADGEQNNVAFSRVSADTFKVVDTGAAIQAGDGCTQDTPNQVTCTTAPGMPIIAVLGDQIDRAVSRTSRSAQFFGEAGNDRLAGASGRDLIDGGEGDDIATGGGQRDIVRGGPGNDQVYGGGSSDVVEGGDGNDLVVGGNGNDSVSGGAGDDVLREDSAPNGTDTLIGGAGSDTADYSARSAPVGVDLNDLRDDGDVRTNERDDVRESVEVVLGGAAGDKLLGRDTSDDTLIGGTGDDFIDGRRGDDHVDGGPGIDQIAARDLSADTIGCGDGSDSVAADERDAVAADCENVRRTVSITLALAARPIFPTLMFRLRCPATAFKFCAGKVIVATAGKLPTPGGLRNLTVAVKRFTAAPGSERLTGVRVRGGTRVLLRRHALEVRARISGFDGAGPARHSAIRFRLRRGA